MWLLYLSGRSEPIAVLRSLQGYRYKISYTSFAGAAESWPVFRSVGGRCRFRDIFFLCHQPDLNDFVSAPIAAKNNLCAAIFVTGGQYCGNLTRELQQVGLLLFCHVCQL